MIGLRSTFTTLAALAAFTTTPVAAQGLAVGDPERVSFDASLGLVVMEGNEYVFGYGRTLSKLIWQGNAPLLRAGFDTTYASGWTLSGNAGVALLGTSYMEDYDWIDYDAGGPFVPGSGADEWTHRSRHPDTQLDHFFAGQLAVGYDLLRGDGLTLNVNGGVKYTNVQWSAYGGSFVYSDTGFRDKSGNFADGDPAITYRQSLPVLFAGLDGETTIGDLTLKLSAQGGALLAASGLDDHWMRSIRFTDALYPAPALGLAASADYALGTGAKLFASASYDRVFVAHGDGWVDSPDPTEAGFYPGSAGLDFTALALSAGLKGRF